MKHATRIKELCKERGLKVAELERMAGIPPKSISGWDKSNPSSDKIEKVIKALKITRDEYYGDEKTNPPLKLDISSSEFANLMYTMIEENLNHMLPTDNEFKLINLYRKASDRDKNLIQSILAAYEEEEK